MELIDSRSKKKKKTQKIWQTAITTIFSEWPLLLSICSVGCVSVNLEAHDWSELLLKLVHNVGQGIGPNMLDTSMGFIRYQYPTSFSSVAMGVIECPYTLFSVALYGMWYKCILTFLSLCMHLHAWWAGGTVIN